MHRQFGPDEAKRFYDRLGSLQDTQVYERTALKHLVAASDFEHASAVLELGCGTGRLAAQLLEEHLPEAARYVGLDISSTMVGIATRRLGPWSKRATVSQVDGSRSLAFPDRSFDRFVATYVLDLLPDAAIASVLREAHQLLISGGKICVITSTEGTGPISHFVSAAWMYLYKINPSLVGGCRPLQRHSWLDERAWTVEHAEVVTSWGIASEIVVARSL